MMWLYAKRSGLAIWQDLAVLPSSTVDLVDAVLVGGTARSCRTSCHVTRGVDRFRSMTWPCANWC